MTQSWYTSTEKASVTHKLIEWQILKTQLKLKVVHLIFYKNALRILQAEFSLSNVTVKADKAENSAILTSE